VSPVQIFISYARDDDALPPNAVELQDKGFVTALHEQLEYVFKDIGSPRPVLWRDRRAIEPADQFDPLIRDAIEASSILLVVLSPNWMSRPWCRRELDLFKERWRSDGEMKVRQRIVVACKRHVPRDQRPPLLQGQQGYDFFAFEGPSESGRQIDFYSRGRIRLEHYSSVVHELGGYLHRRAKFEIGDQTPDDAGREPIVVPGRPPRDRTVYLAKPASDMVVAYARLVKELEGDGYTVVPSPQSRIPDDCSATAFIDEAINKAELSIHLLGESAGPAPEDAEPIVKLQLKRAGLRVEREAAASDGALKAGFRRIVWAPKLLDDSQDAEGDANVAGVEDRDPFDVLKKFDREITSDVATDLTTDKVDSSNQSKFVDFVIKHLAKSEQVDKETSDVPAGGFVYVYHAPADVGYALQVARALKSKKVAADLPAVDGDPAEVIRDHREKLMECDAVVLCWASASEVWARRRARELNWRKLGRSAKFAYRSVVAGPPPGERKSVFVEFPPPNEIDIVLDLTDSKEPLPEALDPLVHVVQTTGK
jgi:hypothetical protein